MTMIKDIYINNLENVSTDIYRMHFEPGFWYKQQTLDRDTHHLNRHMIDIVQNYIRGDATRMESYIKPGALVYKHQSCKGFFTQQFLTPNAIQSMHADHFGLSDDTRIDSSPNALNQKIKLLEEKVTIHDSQKSLQPTPRSWIRRGRIPYASTRRPNSCLSRINYLQTGGRHLRGCDYQIKH